MAASSTTITKRDTSFWKGWWIAFGLSGLIIVLVTLPPFVGPSIRFYVMQGFASVCHQLADRSPELAGVKLAVCHRCYGIYWGLPIAVVGFLFLGHWDAKVGHLGHYLLPLSLLPLGADWLLGAVGIWTNTPFSRMFTGALFGLVAGYYLARAFSSVFVQKTTRVPLESEEVGL